MIKLGDTLVCAETGKTFVAAKDGCSFNYAHGVDGRIISDEGVDIMERRELLDRSRPFSCYVSCDECSITGWKGNVLGTIVSKGPTALPFGRKFSHWHGKNYSVYHVRDVHGGMWWGKSSPGVHITLHPMKEGVKK